MAVEQFTNQIGNFVAGADLSANQYSSVVLTAGVWQLTGAGALADGILLNKPLLGEPANVLLINNAAPKALAGAAFAQDADLMSDATGRFITATATNEIIGKATAAAAAAGEIVQILFTSRGVA